MNKPAPKLTSSASSHWRGTVASRHGFMEVTVDGQQWPEAKCPPLDSLERRWKNADPSWLDEWLADDVDPTRPE